MVATYDVLVSQLDIHTKKYTAALDTADRERQIIAHYERGIAHNVYDS